VDRAAPRSRVSATRYDRDSKIACHQAITPESGSCEPDDQPPDREVDALSRTTSNPATRLYPEAEGRFFEYADAPIRWSRIDTGRLFASFSSPAKNALRSSQFSFPKIIILWQLQ
jgi:hypothetical protein